MDLIVTKGGSIATLGSQHAVASYGSLGDIIQCPNGIVSTVPVTGGVLAIWSPGNEAAMGSLIDNVMNGGDSPGITSKASIPGQILAGKSTTTGDDFKVGVQIAQFTGNSSAQRVNVLLFVILGGLALLGEL